MVESLTETENTLSLRQGTYENNVM